MQSFQLSISPGFPSTSQPVLEGVIHTENPRLAYLLEFWFNEAELSLPHSTRLRMSVEEIKPPIPK